MCGLCVLAIEKLYSELSSLRMLAPWLLGGFREGVKLFTVGNLARLCLSGCLVFLHAGMHPVCTFSCLYTCFSQGDSSIPLLVCATLACAEARSEQSGLCFIRGMSLALL